MKNNRQKKLNYLSNFFLKFKDPDIAYYKTSRFLYLLNNYDITISDIQYQAYQCKKENI